MEILVLQSTSRSLRFSCFTDADTGAMRRVAPEDCEEVELDHIGLQSALDTAQCRFGGRGPDIIAVRIVYGGSQFKTPVFLDHEVAARLNRLVPESPMHMPKSLMIISHCQEVCPEIPIILFFETSFFCGLPAREYLYAIEPKSGSRRVGYHGLFHEAACNAARLRQAPLTGKSGPSVVSIYCGDHNEIAAANGTRPVMVTSGASPLEGLPGTTMCGDIDPAVLLEIATRKKWGPEQINTVISRHSGITALAGCSATLETVFANSDSGPLSRVREIMQYRILLATGMAAATLGSIDVIVFSGPFSRVGTTLGPYLASRLFGKGPQRNVQWFCLDDRLDDLIAKRTRMLDREFKIAAMSTRN